jgi:hypothetical protein
MRSHRNVWANWHILGQPNTCLAISLAAAGLLVEARLGFGYASTEIDGNDGAESDIRTSRLRLGAAAKLLRRHPRLAVHVDAHCGTAAPSNIAPSVSQERGRVVRDALHVLGAPRARTGHW